MSTFCAKIGEFSYFLWNSSKSPPFWINPTDPHPQKSVPPFGPKIPQNGKIPPFWPHCWLLSYIRSFKPQPKCQNKNSYKDKWLETVWSETNLHCFVNLYHHSKNWWSLPEIAMKKVVLKNVTVSSPQNFFVHRHCFKRENTLTWFKLNHPAESQPESAVKFCSGHMVK